jgi:hypothetical protein
MYVNAKLAAAASAVLLFASIGVARADDTTPAKTPGSQGLSSVSRNAAKDPDNRGLKNAETRIESNIDRREDRKAAKADRDERKKAKADRDDRDRHVDRVEHAERVERPERPDRPQRPGRT